jgi:hypothetical protein
VGRDLISDTVWVDATIARIERDGLLDGNVVLADSRFPNEAEATTSRGGIVVRVNRPGVGPESQHASEISLDDWEFDAYFDNDSDMDGLSKAVTSWYDFLEISL